jgi:carboxymethylenebutenolidase
MGEYIRIEDDKVQGGAYLAVPESGRGPGVLILHAWWGFNDFFEALCERVCAEGFVALGPDYYRGEVATTIVQAKALRTRMDRSYAYGLANCGLDHLLSLGSVAPKRIAAFGFSLGCGAALELARRAPNALQAVVLFYGTGGGKFDSARADFLGHFAEHDKWGAHEKKVNALQARLSKSGGEVVFHTYPGTGHWFFESDRPEAYDPQSADIAWRRTADFLRRKLSESAT